MPARPDNVVLIGMPGVGKSTLGVLLAKATSRDFLDTDVLIQRRENRPLQDILDRDGPTAFRAIEERHVLSLRCQDTVIATGGSVVYSTAAVQHLKSHGLIVHLDLPLSLLIQRLTDLGSRGVVRVPGQSMEDLHRERAPLYAAAADITISCAGKTHEGLVDEIIATLEQAAAAATSGRARP